MWSPFGIARLSVEETVPFLSDYALFGLHKYSLSGEVGGRVHFHRERFNPATGSPTATLLRLHPSRRPLPS